jgi:hypothetical protein
MVSRLVVCVHTDSDKAGREGGIESGTGSEGVMRGNKSERGREKLRQGCDEGKGRRKTERGTHGRRVASERASEGGSERGEGGRKRKIRRRRERERVGEGEKEKGREGGREGEGSLTSCDRPSLPPPHMTGDDIGRGVESWSPAG